MTIRHVSLFARYSIGALSCLLFTSVFAQGVSRVEGSLTPGQTLTIIGTGFGSKPQAAPLYYWDFSSSTSTSPLSRRAYTGKIRGALSNTVTASGSANALRSDVGGITEAVGPTDGIPFSSDRLYVWLKRYYGFNIATDRGPSGLNLKFFRIWHVWTHDILMSYEGSQGVASGRTYAEGTAESATWWTMPHESNKWLIEEWEYRNGDIGQTNGILNYSRNGRLAYPKTQRFLMRTSAHPELYNTLFLDQVSNNTLSSGKYIYLDTLYVDDTWHRVVISDEPTWQSVVYNQGTERTREIQIPTSWSDTRITVVVRKGGLSSLSNSYLYVIGGDGNPVNTNGFPLSGMNEKVPSAPSGVTVR